MITDVRSSVNNS